MDVYTPSLLFPQTGCLLVNTSVFLQHKNDAEPHSSDSVWQAVPTKESDSAELDRIDPTHPM